MSHILGFDAGFGNIKIWDKNGGSIYASHVSIVAGQRYANTIAENGEVTELATLVAFGEGRFYTGKYAGYEGLSIDNLGMDRLTGSLEIRALFYSALSAHMTQHRGIRKPLVVYCGLPFTLLTDENFGSTETAVNEWLVGEHEWEVDGKTHRIEVERVVLKSQAVGSVLDYALNSDGTVTSGSGTTLRDDLGVVSVGYNTVELMALSNMRQVNNMTSSEMLGVRRLLEIVNSDSAYSLSELDLKLRDNLINGRLAAAMHGWSEMVQSYINSSWGSRWPRFKKVIVVGGGATLLRKDLERYFEGKAHIPDLPIESIARGLYKRGVADDKKGR